MDVEEIIEAQHRKLDEIIEEARKEMHKMLDKAHEDVEGKALPLPPHMVNDNYLVPKLIIDLWCKRRLYKPPKSLQKEEELIYKKVMGA